MIRRALIAALVLAATLSAVSAASAAAQRGFADSDIEIIDGSGRVRAVVRGALIGSVEKGTVTVTDLPGGPVTDVFVKNADTAVEVDDDTTVYTGENLRFRVFRGRWRVQIQGTGIFTSMVGTGFVGLGGDGRYSLAGAPARPWPAEWTTLKLGDA